jgi:acyl-CoA thioesterase FadM
VALLYFVLPFTTFSKKKEKPALPEVLLKAQTAVVIVQPDAGEPMNDPQQIVTRVKKLRRL